MITKDNEPIVRMRDGGYIVQHGQYRYVVRDSDLVGAFKKAEVEAYIVEHPESVIPELVPPPPPPPTLEQVLAMRRAAYQIEADPLFFGYQRGENTEQDWLNKIVEIKVRYPKPE